LDDKNLTISNTANDILRTLGRQDTKNELCRIAINDSNQTALEIAVECGYLPSGPAQRAAFLFLTEQWEQYESLDFDQRLLRTVFESAEPKLRHSITDKLRKTGRTDFLTVVVGGDYRSRAVEMSDSEAEMMVQMLVNNQEWPKLWPLVFELSVCWGIQIMQHLIRADWVPADELDKHTYHQLAEIVPDKIILSLDQITRALPPALQRATANVSGRINDLAFSPNKPVIAIGSGNRKVALWDFQKAEQYALINGFEHSIGNVNFTGSGDLVCSERTNGSDQCSVYTWAGGELLKLGTHRGSLTALEPVGDSMLLTTGRDHYARVWSIPERKMVAERRFRDWPRTACVSNDAGRAALVVKGGFVVSLPDLKDISISTWASSSVSSCAAFSTANNELVAGYLSGQVLYCTLLEYNKEHKSVEAQPTSGMDILADMREKLVDYEYYSANGKRIVPQKLCAHPAPVCGVAIPSRYSVIISVSTDGQLQFTSTQTRQLIGKIDLPGGSLTSLHVSPDGSFMALGDSQSRMSLWDLRVLDIPGLLSRPCGRAFHDDLTAIAELLEEMMLSEDVRSALAFLQCVLRHRYRYDIEIGEAATIQVGEFDIEIEG
jgi:hypothetical protein